MHKYPQNQSYVGSSGQTLTTNVYMTLCTRQIRQTHVLCGCTKFGTELKLGTKLIRSLRLLKLGQGRSLDKGGVGMDTHRSREPASMKNSVIRGAGGGWGHEQQILSSHIPPRHRYMVIATNLSSLF